MTLSTSTTIASGATAETSKYPPRVIPEGTWQQSATKDGWFKSEGAPIATITTVSAKELATWEKATQRGIDGKDRFRGIKQKARLDMYVAETTTLTGWLTPLATADATGTP